MKQLILTLLLTLPFSITNVFSSPSHIHFLAGKASHGWNEHEFVDGCKILSNCLNESGLDLQTTLFEGWNDEIRNLGRNDAIVIYSDGITDHIAIDHVRQLNEAYERGVGIFVMHFALEPPTKDSPIAHFLNQTIGGCFEVNWSVNPIWTVKSPILSDHPICNGVETFEMKDEWYYHMRFLDKKPNINTVLSAIPPTSSLGSDGPRSGNATVRSAVQSNQPQILMWTKETGHKRGAGMTGGHFLHNWRNDEFRKLVLNGIIWCTGQDVPQNGINSKVEGIVRYKTIEEAIARKDTEDILQHLIKAPDIANRPGRGKYTPLHVAVMRKNMEAVRLLLKHHANPNQLTGSNESALHLAANRTTPEMCKLLLENGANPDLLDKQGWTALHNAAAKNKVSIASSLLENGANVNIISKGGGTPLHEAAVSSCEEMLELLIKHGCDPSVRSKTSTTALDIAKEYKNEAAIHLLENVTK